MISQLKLLIFMNKFSMEMTHDPGTSQSDAKSFNGSEYI